MTKINPNQPLAAAPKIEPAKAENLVKPKQAPLADTSGVEAKKAGLAEAGGKLKGELHAKLPAAKSPLAAPAPAPKNPADALNQIEKLEKPNLKDIPKGLPEEDKNQILEQRQKEYDTKRAGIADAAIANSKPPKLEDFKALPPKVAALEYQDALNTHNQQINKLKTISREAKEANLSKDPEFKNLPAETQKLLKAQMAKNEGDPAAVDTLVKVGQSAGFGKLTKEEQAQFLNYVGGANKEISGPARSALAAKFSDPAFDKNDPESFRKFLKDQPGLTSVVAGTATPGEFDSRRQPYTVTGPEEVKDHAFRSGKADANKYIVEVNGKKIPVYISKDQDSGLNHHTIEETAKGIASLPQASLEKVNSVTVDGKQNPDDAYWAKEYNTPGFRSYMTAGASGDITIYPTSSKQSQHALDASLIHETGHTLSKQEMGEGDGGFIGNLIRDLKGKKKWSDWEAAAKKDGVSVSQYAKNSKDEDFAETLTLYMKVKGTPQEAEIRAIFPERFKFLDEMLKK